MPANVVKTESDERLWVRAKQQAEKQGHGSDYAYVMKIFQNMKGSDKSAAYHTGYQRVLDAAFSQEQFQ